MKLLLVDDSQHVNLIHRKSLCFEILSIYLKDMRLSYLELNSTHRLFSLNESTTVLFLDVESFWKLREIIFICVKVCQISQSHWEEKW
jgi:hypothetical protein